MLINCAAYQDGRKLADIKPEEISDYVGRPDCFVWVALFNPDPAELSQMQQEFGLHELAVEDARHGHQRPKIEEYGDSLFAVLHTVDAEGGDMEIGEVDVFVGPNYLLSVRSRTEHGFANVRARCEREPHLLRQGSGFVFYALMDAIVDRYFPVLDALEEKLEAVEALIFSGNSARSNIESLYQLKQKLMTLKHAAGPLLEASGKLHGGRVPQVCAGTQDYYRDVYDHLIRINQSIDSLRDMVTTAISVNLSLITLQENETTRRIAAYAALVAVPTMIAGVYGMNFKNMPELSWEFGYPLALSIMAVLDGVLFYRLRKAGWL
ncbi:MAG: magnesium/cobalt transporter CorA [Proteobacteria bacterium]|nr:magnesium/cobalt transporter CorA [Pseudomonadota bacterium]